MTAAAERLVDLLPALYRHRGRGPLEELLTVVGEQVAVIEENIAQLYDDLFIETCAPWVVPYLGDLVGARGVHPVTEATAGERAYVANTVAYRRRKGTAAMLEQLAHDVTDWDARAVEFFLRLATTQYMAHLRPANRSIVSIVDPGPLSWLSSPFDDLPHTVDVRRIGNGRGRHNIPNVGIFVWRHRAFPTTDSPAVAVDGRRYRFSPFGFDTALVTLPRGEADMAHIAEPLDAPVPIGRLALHRDPTAFYGSDRSFFVEVDGAAADIVAADLSDVAGGWAHVPDDIPAGVVAVDPVLGRLAFADDNPARRVVVSFHTRGTAEMGGGEYPRLGSFAAIEGPVVPVTTSIADALAALGTASGTVELPDSGRYDWPSPLTLAAGQRVEVRAAEGRRAVVVPAGEARIEGVAESELVLNGLLVAGGSVRVVGPLQALAVRHCTFVPEVSIAVEEPASTTEVEIDHSIVGPLRMAATTTLVVRDSVVERPATTAGDATFERATVLGPLQVRTLVLGSDSIFLGVVQAERQQAGCVRFSYVPPGSRTPRRHRCAGEPPRFVSLGFGLPGYAEPARTCPDAVRTGASTGSEMGAFSGVLQPLREANLQARLDEFVRFSLEVGVLDAT